MNEGLRNFDRQIDVCITEAGGRGLRLDLAAVERLVRGDPQSALSYIERQCRLAASQPIYLQTALVVAEAYLVAFADPAAVQRVRERAASLFADDLFDAGWTVYDRVEEAAAEPPERERARQWWRDQPFHRAALCDDCGEPIPRGDGYLTEGRTETLWFGSIMRCGPDLLCRRCFHRPRRLGVTDGQSG